MTILGPILHLTSSLSKLGIMYCSHYLVALMSHSPFRADFNCSLPAVQYSALSHNHQILDPVKMSYILSCKDKLRNAK